MASQSLSVQLSPFQNESVLETICECICGSAGAQFIGIQDDGCLTALVLFRDGHGSCLALPLDQLSTDNVRRKLQVSAIRFGAA